MNEAPRYYNFIFLKGYLKDLLKFMVYEFPAHHANWHLHEFIDNIFYLLPADSTKQLANILCEFSFTSGALILVLNWYLFITKHFS